MDKININQNNINDDIFMKKEKKELNYDRIKKIVKKSKKSKQNVKENNFKIIKFILSDFNHKIKRTVQFIFNL